MNAKQSNPAFFSRKKLLPTLIWNFVFTGCGHFYLGQYRKAGFFIAIHLLLLSILGSIIFLPHIKVSTLILGLFLIFLCFEIFVLSDAFLVSCRMRRQAKQESQVFLKLIFQTIILLCVMFVCNVHILGALALKQFVVPVPPTPSPSMKPTIEIGDVFVVNKYSFHKNPPKRGDVIVFDFPHDINKALVKRIVAIGGEEVEISRGRIMINGRASDLPQIAKNFYQNAGKFGQTGQKVVVPKGHYFVLGDHSEQSKDSRHWGFVNQQHILGKAYKIIYPFSRSGRID